MGLGWTEILVILLVVMVLFGAKKIPELAKGLGTGIKEFKKAVNPEDERKDLPQNPQNPSKTSDAAENDKKK